MAEESPMPAKKYLNVREVAEYLGYRPSTIYALAERGELPAYKPGALLIFKIEEIDEWVEKGKLNS